MACGNFPAEGTSDTALTEGFTTSHEAPGRTRTRTATKKVARRRTRTGFGVMARSADDVFRPVDTQDVSREPYGPGARQGHEDARDVFRRRQPARGVDRETAFDHLLVPRNLPERRRVRHARANRVDGDLPRRELDGELPAVALERRLRGRDGAVGLPDAMPARRRHGKGVRALGQEPAGDE